MYNKYAVVSTKGGCGKSTLAANLGATLADMGQRVLLVDTDPQASLSSIYEVDPADSGLYQMVTTANPEGCISRTSIDNLDIVLSDDTGKRLDTWIRQSSSHFQYLNAALVSIEDRYDYCIIDTKGADGTGEMQEMAIRASDVLLSPISPQWIAVTEFVRGTVDMLRRLEPPPGIQTGLRPIPPMFGIIYALNQTTDARAAAQQLRGMFYPESKGKVSVLETVVPDVAAYNQATGRHTPAHRFEVKRKGPTPSAYQTMLALVHELLPHLSDVTPHWDKAGNPGKSEAPHG